MVGGAPTDRDPDPAATGAVEGVCTDPLLSSANIDTSPSDMAPRIGMKSDALCWLYVSVARRAGPLRFKGCVAAQSVEGFEARRGS